MGNKGINENTTPADLFNNGTTCVDNLDKSGYWVPALYIKRPGHRRREQFPNRVVAYYYGTAGETTEPMPAGAEMVAGNSTATSPQPLSVVAWSCGNSSNTSSPLRSAPYDCRGIPNTHGVTEVIKFPYCWDGTGLKPADFAYGDPAADFECPAAFPHRIPKLTEFVRYDNRKGTPLLRGDQVKLASDYVAHENHGITLHGDFMDGWDQTHMDNLTAMCEEPGTAHNCHSSAGL